MLKTVSVLNEVDEKYHKMIKMVNIPDFTKCIAQFAGLNIDEVSEDVIKKYLITWARNKYRFFELFGEKLRVDSPISYVDMDRDIPSLIEEIGTRYPVYALWLNVFSRMRQNKIDQDDWYHFDWDARRFIGKVFPQYHIVGSTITHFFKKQLNAPDELITEIGRLFENQKIEATYTLSIDPVDMMLASENPYGWTSCYRLETPNDGSHADGCLASVLDDKVIISYIWNNEGEFKLYDKFLLKKVRYKRMRQWIAVSDNMSTLDFCAIYPGKGSYDSSFYKQLRDYVETLIANYKKLPNKWLIEHGVSSERTYYYGYSEFGNDNLYSLVDADPEDIDVYNEEIECPCGCGSILIGSHACDYDDGDGEYSYNGEGFCCENYIRRYWCEHCDDYCDHEPGDCDCRDCSYWREDHPVCDLDEDEECGNVDWDLIDDDDSGLMRSCKGHCEGCALWEAHHSLDNEEDDEIENENE